MNETQTPKTHLFRLCFLLVFALGLGTFWYWTANKKMNFLDPEYPMWTTKVEFAKACTEADILIIGDSRPVAGLIPSRIGPKVLNYAIGGGTPIENYYQLKQLLDCPKLPAAVVISMATLHFQKEDIFWERPVKFGFLNSTQVREIEANARKFGETEMLGQTTFLNLETRLKAALYTAYFPSYYFAALSYSGPSGNLSINLVELENTRASRGQHYFGMQKDFKDHLDPIVIPEFKLSNMIDSYFVATLDLLRAKGVPTFFLPVPNPEGLREQYMKSVYADFTPYFRKFENREGLEILGSVEYFLPDPYFGDSFHLNPRGALAWSLETCEQLKLYKSTKNLVWADCKNTEGWGAFPVNHVGSVDEWK